ncbi:hypothetical protein O3597_26045 [Verrucosispora sp. WMMA2044]|uniref:hypothetical protein n=1 Tax=Verrucosispora sp. WMMA2044 TaxID=3016419 RepID=UPI00248B2794|nr:hypothetical protein [Verrucosispora sp. WMMA2044]WBB48504.1 hypothetical protein O3597_26045 [Verrucosispora sp. WMMA2044]
MNNRTTPTPNSRPAAVDPKPPVRIWNAEGIDAALRAARIEVQRQFEETWDVTAGLQEIMLAERYHQAVASREGKVDLEAGLAEIVGPPSPSWPDRGNEGSTLPTDGGVDLVVTGNGTYQVYLPKVMHQPLPTPRDTLEQVRSVAGRILTTIEEVRQTDAAALVHSVAYAEAMSIARHSAERLQGLPDAIEGRLVTREQAVQVVESTGVACQAMWRHLHVRTVGDSPLPLGVRYCEQALLDLSKEAFQLRVPVQRLFEPSDDLVDIMG